MAAIWSHKMGTMVRDHHIDITTEILGFHCYARPGAMLALVPPDVLAAPPSREDGIDENAEDQLRRFGAKLIQRAALAAGDGF